MIFITQNNLADIVLYIIGVNIILNEQCVAQGVLLLFLLKYRVSMKCSGFKNLRHIAL